MSRSHREPLIPALKPRFIVLLAAANRHRRAASAATEQFPIVYSPLVNPGRVARGVEGKLGAVHVWRTEEQYSEVSSLTWADESLGHQLVDSMLEAKLQPPLARSEWVARTRLLKELQRATQRPVTLIAAPAGYGKTTVVTQWLASVYRPESVAWISLDMSDNEPVQLWTDIAIALDRAGCVIARDIAGFIAASSHDMVTVVLPRIVDAIAALGEDLTVIVDDFDIVRSAECNEQIDFFVKHLPPNSHLMLITRADPTLRLGRLRAAGQLLEIRADDLAFNSEEASSLLVADRVQLAGDDLLELMRRTEGWPAGLYLATLSLTGRADPSEFVRHFSGNNRFIGDYLTEEVLSRQSADVRQFILDMSIVDRFTAPLCDHMNGGRPSAKILRDLQHTNLFLIPLDAENRWFRFHHLFGAVARSALETEQPDRAVMLHGRAADWLSENGYVDAAVEHALAAGHSDHAASLVQASWLRYFDAGLGTTVRRWLRDLEASAASQNTATIVTAAWMAALSGQKEEMDRRLDQLNNVSDDIPLPDGTRSVESAVALIRGLFGFGGPLEMLASARRAAELETNGNTPWYALARAALGHANYVAGDLDEAADLLPRAAYSEAAPAVVRILALAILSLTQAELGRLDRSHKSAADAMEVVEARSLHEQPSVAFAFTALGQSQAASGELEKAMATLDHGLKLRRKVPGLSPWPTIHHLLVMGRVAIMANDLPLARRLLDEVSLMIRQYPQGMTHMIARLEATQKGLRESQSPGPNNEHLTAREIDILRRLKGPQNLSQIASELYLSPNTVKTHTSALYRKLGARSRSEAVKIGRERLLI
jgi:LuxR family transcriptional regulator, maltose regulon positive regulatory protein